MRPNEYICYGCKAGNGEALRVKIFGVLKECPNCGRPFHQRPEAGPCPGCKTPVEGGGLCASCKAEKDHG